MSAFNPFHQNPATPQASQNAMQEEESIQSSESASPIPEQPRPRTPMPNVDNVALQMQIDQLHLRNGELLHENAQLKQEILMLVDIIFQIRFPFPF